MSLGQKERVLAALRSHPDGITQLDFLREPTLDGGETITRLAARIKELKDDGHPIVDAGTLGGCKVYRIEQPAADGQLFTVPAVNHIYTA